MSAGLRRWVPAQHGAWAMLIVPFVVGVILRAKASEVPGWVAPLVVLWIIGYCLFMTIISWLKRPAGQRRMLLAPLMVYGAVCAGAGLGILLSGGLALIWWPVLFAPLVAVALQQVLTRRERSILSGLVTVAAACLMFYVVRCGGWPLVPLGRDWPIGLLLFGYFGGTVFHVKSLIRERRAASSLRNSLVWHGAWTVGTAVAAAVGVNPWWWPVIFAGLTVRTWVMRRRQDAGTVLRPGTIGIVEVVASLVVLVASVL